MYGIKSGILSRYAKVNKGSTVKFGTNTRIFYIVCYSQLIFNIMPCVEINNGILCMANIEFACPKCQKVYSDDKDMYLNRCNKNANGCTKIKCSCGTHFYMTYNYKGDAVSFLP